MWHLTAVEWATEAVRLLACLVIGGNVGSFLNVVAWRVPRGESVVLGRSHCPSCGHLVRAGDNIPVIGWLRLRGRCRDCGGVISPRYPLVEGACASIALTLALVDGADLAAFLGHCVLFSLLVVAALFERDGFDMPAEGLAAALVFAVVGAASVPGMEPARPDWPWASGAGAPQTSGPQGASWRGLPLGVSAAAAALVGGFAGWSLAAACLPRLAARAASSEVSPAGRTTESDAIAAAPPGHGGSAGSSDSQPAWSLVLIGAFLGWQAALSTTLLAWPLHLARRRIVAAFGRDPSEHWCVELCVGALAVLSLWRAVGG